jgi:hypothetical protein
MDIEFNSLNINDRTNYFVIDSDHDKVAEQELNVQRIARTNDSIVLRKNYQAKVINIHIIVKDTSRDNLDSRLDTLRETIEVKDKNLDIDYASGIRRYICTGHFQIEERKLNWARVKLVFTCYKAFGENTTTTSESFTGKTTSPLEDDIEIDGTAPAQPDITITINSVTSSGDKYLQFKNLENEDYVKITTDDWAADDVIVISTREKRCTKNGTVIEYLGIMPEWLPGDNDWEYTDNFDARNIDIDIVYLKRYL